MYMSNKEETFRRYPIIGCRASSVLSVALMLFLVDLLVSAVVITGSAGDNRRGKGGLVVKMYRHAELAGISFVEKTLNSIS